MIQVTKEELKELLEIAFDKGWMGYCDLREAVVEELLGRCRQYKEKSGSLSTPYTVPLVVGQGWVSSGGPTWGTLDSNVWTINGTLLPAEEEPPETSEEPPAE